MAPSHLPSAPAPWSTLLPRPPPGLAGLPHSSEFPGHLAASDRAVMSDNAPDVPRGRCWQSQPLWTGLPGTSRALFHGHGAALTSGSSLLLLARMQLREAGRAALGPWWPLRAPSSPHPVYRSGRVPSFPGPQPPSSRGARLPEFGASGRKLRWKGDSQPCRGGGRASGTPA